MDLLLLIEVLLYTTDTGDSWKVLRTVAENKLIQVYFDNDSTAFAVDEFGGIIKIGFSYTTDINQQVESAVPEQYTLEQNYLIRSTTRQLLNIQFRLREM
ncbi:MAG: hypothetical protein IPN18_19895 [Ignavibacteriales bacterium]|nr:hypothetical protein [Ignavibacteriales bacterium]